VTTAHGERRLQPVHQLVCLSDMVRTKRERTGHGRDGLRAQVVLELRAVSLDGMQRVELRDLEELLERGRESSALVCIDRLARGREAGRGRRVLDRPVSGGPSEAPEHRADRPGILPGHGLELLPRHGLAR
jgi:hypothetical protein